MCLGLQRSFLKKAKIITSMTFVITYIYSFQGSTMSQSLLMLWENLCPANEYYCRHYTIITTFVSIDVGLVYCEGNSPKTDA